MSFDRPRPAEEWIDPRSLDLSRRFDIAIKYQYAKAVVSGVVAETQRRAYLEHVRRLNAFTEIDSDGTPTKLGASEFLREFDALIASVRRDGFDGEFAVPVSSDGIALNGAHRVAAAMAVGCELGVYEASAPEFSGYTYRDFESRGLPQAYLDLGVQVLAEVCDSIHLAFIFGSVYERHASIVTELASKLDVLAELPIQLTPVGQENLIRVIYDGERWLGKREYGFRGARGKAKPCFPPGAPSIVRVLLLRHRGDHDSLVDIKERVRQPLGHGKHSMHITDRAHEVEMCLPWLFDTNGRHLLNHKRFGRLLAFDHDTAQFAAMLKAQQLPADQFCVVGSAVMSLYGLRDCRDLDVVAGSAVLEQARSTGIELGNEHWESYGFDIDELVYDPSSHVRFEGLKFTSLQVLAELKRKRGEAKDLVDLSLIAGLLEEGDSLRRAALRAVGLVRLYTNPRWVRSFAGHWLHRLGVRVRRRRS